MAFKKNYGSMQTLEPLPGDALELNTISFTVVPGEREFQPQEKVSLVRNGSHIGVAQVTRYAHSRVSNVTEVNFIVLELKVAEGVTTVAEPVDEDLADSTDGRFLLSRTEEIT